MEDGKSATLGGSLQVKGVTGLEDALTVADGKSARFGGSLQVEVVTGLEDALTVADGRSATMGGSLQVKGITNLDDALTVADGKSATLGGSLQVKGITNLDDALTVADGKSATLGGSLQVKGITNLDDALTVADGKSATLGGSLQVKAVAGLEDALTVATGKSTTLGGTLGVQGVSTFSDTTASVSQSTGAVVINGGVGIAGDVYCSNTFNLSDKRLKENITPLPNALETIDKLGGYTFTWNNNAGVNLSGRSAIGCIAQEVDEAIPGNLATNRNPHSDIFAVEYTRLVPYLIESVKTLKRKHEHLEQELIAVKRMKRE